MESFYGGKPGFSFIIVKSFLTVAEMIAAFKGGPSYTEVHYDEYVFINTENKNDPDNGSIYRRGYDYTNEMGGAIYIGTIVGPAGRAPMLQLDTIENVKAQQDKEGYVTRYSEGNYQPPTSLIPGKVGEYNDNPSEGGGDEDAKWTLMGLDSEDDSGKESWTPMSLVPGREGNEYNDNIEWACCSVRDINKEDTTAYIGFKIPYLVMEFSAENVDPYIFANQNLAERTDDKSHPFYERWNFNIPKGIKGESVKNFRVIDASREIPDYNGKTDDIGGINGNLSNPRKILVYDYYNYDNNASGEPVSLFLGDYNMIDNISLDDNGTFIIQYTHNNTYQKNLAWVKNITIADDGKITLHYTGGMSPRTLENTHLRWINSIEVKDNGQVWVFYNDSNNPEILDEKIKWITNVYIKDENDVDDHRFHVVYNTGEDVSIGNPINYINEMTINEENYHLLIYYTDPGKRGTIEYNGKNGWIDLGSIKDDAGILIGFNLSPTDYPGIETISGALDYLNGTYSNGLTNPLYYGKIVTIGNSNENKAFYAFDYNTNKWYYLGKIGNNETLWTMIAEESDATLNSQKDKLALGGVWFIVEE